MKTQIMFAVVFLVSVPCFASDDETWDADTYFSQHSEKTETISSVASAKSSVPPQLDNDLQYVAAAYKAAVQETFEQAPEIFLVEPVAKKPSTSMGIMVVSPDLAKDQKYMRSAAELVALFMGGSMAPENEVTHKIKDPNE